MADTSGANAPFRDLLPSHIKDGDDPRESVMFMAAVVGELFGRHAPLFDDVPPEACHAHLVASLEAVIRVCDAVKGTGQPNVAAFRIRLAKLSALGGALPRAKRFRFRDLLTPDSLRVLDYRIAAIRWRQPMPPGYRDIAYLRTGRYLFGHEEFGTAWEAAAAAVWVARSLFSGVAVVAVLAGADLPEKPRGVREVIRHARAFLKALRDAPAGLASDAVYRSAAVDLREQYPWMVSGLAEHGRKLVVDLHYEAAGVRHVTAHPMAVPQLPGGVPFDRWLPVPDRVADCRDADRATDAACVCPALSIQTDRPAPSADAYAKLASLVQPLRLIGKQQRAAEAVAEGRGGLTLTDLAALCEWDNPDDGWGNIRKPLNEKLKPGGLRLERLGSRILAVSLPTKGG